VEGSEVLLYEVVGLAEQIHRTCLSFVITGVCGGKESMHGEIEIGVVIDRRVRVYCLCFFIYTSVAIISLEEKNVAILFTLPLTTAQFTAIVSHIHPLRLLFPAAHCVL